MSYGAMLVYGIEGILVAGSMYLCYQAGFANGRFEAYLDASTIDDYHRCANELSDDDDPAALEACWRDIVSAAQAESSGWYDSWLTTPRAHLRTFPSFWRRSRAGGMVQPRRLSRSQKTRLVEALRPHGRAAQ